MPRPRKGETEQEFVSRCIPIVLDEGTADDQKQAAAICGGMFREARRRRNSARRTNNEGRTMPKPEFTTNLLQTVNFSFTANKKKVKKQKLEGRDHFVVPMVMLTEGVHEGDQGPLLYLKEEIGKVPFTWNHRPIVVYHPKINGKGVSACDPLILSSRKVGLVLNSTYDTKLRSEAWLEESRLPQVDERVLEAIEKEQMMEVSTGLFLDLEKKEGEWKGEKYVGIAHNFRPDHLALLPDMTGACSIADGAGLLQLNEASYETIRSKLQPLLGDRLGTDYVWIERIFPSFLIYSMRGKFYMLGYESSDDGCSLSDENPIEVESAFRKMDGEFVGNMDDSFYLSTREKSLMAKKEVVDRLIANTHTKFDEKDRSWLMTLSDDQADKLEPHEDQVKSPMIPDGGKPGLNKDNQMVKDPPPDQIQPSEPQQVPVKHPNQPVQPQNQPFQQPQNPPANPQPTGNQWQQPMTLEDFMRVAPPEVQNAVQYGMAVQQQEKDRLIQIITANRGNIFKAEELQSKEIPELHALAALAQANAGPEQRFDMAAVNARMPHYAGAGVYPTLTGNRGGPKIEPLAAPVMNFKPK